MKKGAWASFFAWRHVRFAFSLVLKIEFLFYNGFSILKIKAIYGL
tara:strand:- start:734 stop:868 length:135 start_codon:yes stop_codon:yes gene_type:complete